MKNAPSRAVVCYSRNEIYSRLAWLLQPSRYRESGPAAFVAIQTDTDPWANSTAGSATGSATADRFGEDAAAFAKHRDPMISLIDQALQSIGEDRDLICLLEKNLYGVLRAPVTRPAEPEAFGHAIMESLASQTSIALWGSVAVSAQGDTPGLVITHCIHALGQAKQLGVGQLAVFDEVDRTVVQMEAAARQADLDEADSTAAERADSETVNQADGLDQKSETTSESVLNDEREGSGDPAKCSTGSADS